MYCDEIVISDAILRTVNLEMAQLTPSSSPIEIIPVPLKLSRFNVREQQE